MTKRRRPAAQRKLAEARFWGSAPDGPPLVGEIRPTPDPAVVIRSLGAAPLALDPGMVDRHLTAVYEEIVRAASALAAANGLLADGE